ncbi:MAG TPA: HD domain-containing protein [Candidatus Marinimicrobia bacterium]|nr:GTP pyrophosphokinase [Candidatus Neomarinimicrobiota bacterium]MDP6296403.1 HD domain-containing protein [Candidatus Neomarinimicrobiota bacterium]MDP7122270.1 HD domain-containing protein [Candidatus Neomarinimicrobiota bacterium]MDP7483138.1 HD domain-containing protein [Candidatus Neomarinimicrobiota bacterium]MDP7528417.1 HD domain-containing protein [Candidatus Neomarinimicrobiota bacterium]
MTLERAIAIAAEAHAGQKDRAGAPYILHPIRLMIQMDSEDAMMAAVLHDVVENSVWTLDDLRKEGFSNEVLNAVDSLTHRDKEGENYWDYIQRAKSDPIAIKVKLADLEDNLNPDRLNAVTEKDEKRFDRYRKAQKMLL